MSLYVAAYDISSDRRRRRISKTLSGYGRRVQESVFELRLEPDEVAEMRAKLGMLLDVSDLFELVPVDERPTRQRSRWQRQLRTERAVVLR